MNCCYELSATELLVWGCIAHIVADWMLQNDWMAVNKVSLKHYAAYVHSGIHLAALLFVFPWIVASVIAVTHLLIDTRTPLVFYRKVLKQALPGNPVSTHVAIWQDQVAHILVIALAAGFVAMGNVQ